VKSLIADTEGKLSGSALRKLDRRLVFKTLVPESSLGSSNEHR
jgi:hypothetical protein